MIALLATVLVVAMIAAPAFALGVRVGRGRRRVRGLPAPVPRRRVVAGAGEFSRGEP